MQEFFALLSPFSFQLRIIGALVLLGFAALVRGKIMELLLRGLARIFHRQYADFALALHSLLLPLEWGLVLLLGYLLFGAYVPPLLGQHFIKIAVIAWSAWLGMNLVTILHQKNLRRPFLGSSVSNTLFRLLHTIFKSIILIIAIMMVASEIGYDIKGVLAGLGLGGLAVALAAQDVLSQIFGCMVIVIDKPFVIADWIETPEFEGIVETISIRSTKIRTFEDALITMPNAKLVNGQITNWSKRGRRRIQLHLRLAPSTDQKLLETGIQEIRVLLSRHEKVFLKTVRVYLENISITGFEILVECFIPNEGYDNFLGIQEELQFKILKILPEKEIQVAFTLYPLADMQ